MCTAVRSPSAYVLPVVSGRLWDEKSILNPLILSCEPPKVILGTETGSSARAANALNYCSIFLQNPITSIP